VIEDQQALGDLAANIFPFSRGVTQLWCLIKLAITTAMHTNLLNRITMGLGNALLSA